MMSVEELQAKYLEVAGRATGSDDRAYIVWKIREAGKGRIPVGPRAARTGERADVKILPLRLESTVVEHTDDAGRTRGTRSAWSSSAAPRALPRPLFRFQRHP